MAGLEDAKPSPAADPRRAALHAAAEAAEDEPAGGADGGAKAPPDERLAPSPSYADLERTLRVSTGLLLQVPFALWAIRKKDPRYRLSRDEIKGGVETATPLVMMIAPEVSPLWFAAAGFVTWAASCCLVRMAGPPVAAKAVEARPAREGGGGEGPEEPEARDEPAEADGDDDGWPDAADLEEGERPASGAAAGGFPDAR